MSQYPLNNKGIEMLARRFTIICLMLAIFGIGLANIVAEAGYPRKTQARGVIVPCVFDRGPRCGSLERN